MGKSDGKPPHAARAAHDAPEKARQEEAGSGDGAGAEDAGGDLQDKMLGEFRILRRLGRGGMAEVYLAEQTSLKRNVAIKVLRKELVADETYLKRFRTEAMAAAGLSHPNIVQVYAVGEEEGRQYIVQEYVQGLNLREFLTRKGPLDVNLALHTMKQVASALQAAGAAGIVHRDIKPENIMITRRGEVKVADFGLAQLALGGERVSLTQEGVTMGTPLYMSPEQVSGSKVDHRSDLYSLGITYYHVLTGHPPFRGDTALSVAVQHLKKEPGPLSELRPDLPVLFCKIIHKMITKDLDQRYATAQAILKDLKRVSQERGSEEPAARNTDLLANDGAGKSVSGGVRRLPAGLWKAADRPLNRQVIPFLVTAFVIALAAAGAGWLLRTPHPLHAASRKASDVPIKDTAAEQIYYALLQPGDDEAAWQAVITNFPEDRSFCYRAQQELATICLRQGRYDEALARFDQLASLSDLERTSRAVGLAGQAVIYCLRGKYQDSQKTLDTLRPMYSLLNSDMQQVVKETVQRNQQEVGSPAAQGWNEIFRTDEQKAQNSDER